MSAIGVSIIMCLLLIGFCYCCCAKGTNDTEEPENVYYSDSGWRSAHWTEYNTFSAEDETNSSNQSDSNDGNEATTPLPVIQEASSTSSDLILPTYDELYPDISETELEKKRKQKFPNVAT